MFKIARTFSKPAQGANVARGFPAPGSGAQTIGDFVPAGLEPEWVPERPTAGRRSWFAPASPAGGQRGFPEPRNAAQRRPAGSMPNVPASSGLPTYVYVPDGSRGDAAYAPQFGKVLTNPIGAGVYVPHRPQASYGPAAQYVNGAIWWTSQAIPTSVNLQGLTDPAVLAAVLGPINVRAAIRTTG